MIKNKFTLALIVLTVLGNGCTPAKLPTETIQISNTPTSISPSKMASITPTAGMDFGFPASIDPSNRFLFYLHGKIIEDQGIPAVSPDFGEYQYAAILEQLSANGFTVISEQRAKNIDPAKYANRIVEQAKTLLKAGVPPANITVIGASKGAEITILVSNKLQVGDINYVLLAGCHPDSVSYYKSYNITLSGNVLAIRDSVDTLSGSCRDLFVTSEGKGIGRYNEITLSIGTGHGIIYQPLDEWMVPSVAWAMGKSIP